MMWGARIHDVQSGDLLAMVDLASGDWGRGDQTVRSSVMVLHDRYSQSQWRDIIQGGAFWDRVLVYLWEGVPIYAGLIIGAPSYDPRNRLLTIEHTDLSALLSRRWMHGVGPSTGGGGYVPSGTFSVSGVSLRGAVRAILQRTYLDPISAAWPVPVDLPPSEAGSFSKTWNFYEFQNAADMIADLTKMENGPDIDLRPYLTSAGRLRWEQRIGTPDLTGPTHEIVLAAEKNAATSWGVNAEGMRTATGIHFPGKGSEQDMRVGSAAAPVSAGLARDSIFTDKTDDNVTSLSSKARGRLDVLSSAVEHWPISVAASAIPPTTVQVGSSIRTCSYGDPWVADGWKDHRLTGFSGKYGEHSFALNLEAI